MQTFNKKVTQFIEEHKHRTKAKSAALILSLMVVISVCASLIMPAISASEDEEIDVNDTITTLTNDFGDSITDASITVKDGVTTERVPAVVSIKYELKPDFVAESSDPLLNNRITYTLPSNIEVPESSRTGVVQIAGENGTYEIDNNGMIIITFPESFLDSHRSNVITGWIDLDCVIVKSSGNDSDEQKIVFNSTISADVSFAEKQLTSQKTATNNGDGTITWTITVNNQPKDDLEGYTITDTMFANAKFENTSYGTLSGETFTFNSTTDENITLTYTTPITDGDLILNGGYIENSAQLNDASGKKVQSMKKGLNVPATVSIEKSGSAVYSSSEDGESATISWEITIDNSTKRDLDGFTVSDPKFANASNIKVNGTETTASGDSVTLNTGTAEKVIITYETLATEADDYTNTATIKPTNPTDNTTYPTASVRVPQAVDVTKVGTTTSGSGVINWTVTLIDNSGSDDSTFDGYTIDDKLLTEVVNSGGNYTVEPSGTLKADGDKLKLNLNSAKHGNVTITYSTSVELGQDELSADVTNKVGISGSGHTASDSTTVHYRSRNDATKSAGSKTVNKVKDTDGNLTDLTVTIPWTVTYKQDVGDFAGKTISDSLTTDVDGIVSTANDFVVLFEQNADGKFNTATSDYTLSVNNDGSFSIKFSDSEYMKTISGVRITYKTTTNLFSLTEEEVNVPVNFTNTVSYDSYQINGTTTYTVVNTPPYKKYSGTVADESAEGETEINADQLEKLEIDGVEYYVFDWLIEVNPDNSITEDDCDYVTYPSEQWDGTTVDKKTAFKFFSITDTLPEGMILRTTDDYTTTSTNPCIVYQNGYENPFYFNDNSSESSSRFVYDEDNGTVTFDINWTNEVSNKVIYLRYQTLYPVSDLTAGEDGTVSFKNTIKSSGEKEVSQTQTVTPEPKVNTGILNKTLVSSGESTAKYRLEVNSASADLVSDSDVLEIVDSLSTSDLNLTDVTVKLENITVTDADTGEKITLESPYGYNFDNEPEATTDTQTYELTSSDNWNWTLSYAEFEKGSKITIKISGATADSAVGWNLKYDGWKDVFTVASEKADSDGYYTFTGTLSDTYSGDFKLNLWFSSAESVTIENTTESYDYTALLTLKVPDERHLYIDYEYLLYDLNNPERTITVTNVATTQTAVPTKSQSVVKDIELTDQSKAGAESSNWIEFNKVDSENIAVTLSGAEFKLYRYDVQNQKWQVATKFVDYTYGNQTYEDVNMPSEDGWVDVTLTAGDDFFKQASSMSDGAVITTDSSTPYNLNLESSFTKKGTTNKDTWLYMLVEVKSPSGYISSDKPKFFTYSGISSSFVTLARQLSGDSTTTVEFIETASEFNYKNVKSDNPVLPETGGIGTTPYFLVGGAIIIAGGVYYYISKRRKINAAE